MVKFKPLKNPHSAKASLAYSEQVGEYLHAWGINGEMQNLNIVMKKRAMNLGMLTSVLRNFFIF